MHSTSTRTRSRTGCVRCASESRWTIERKRCSARFATRMAARCPTWPSSEPARRRLSTSTCATAPTRRWMLRWNHSPAWSRPKSPSVAADSSLKAARDPAGAVALCGHRYDLARCDVPYAGLLLCVASREDVGVVDPPADAHAQSLSSLDRRLVHIGGQGEVLSIR